MDTSDKLRFTGTEKLPNKTIQPYQLDDEVCPWDLSDDIKLVQQISFEAGRIALDYFKRDIKQWDKSANNPVSEADLAVDQFLKTVLLENRTGYGWLSEETEDRPERLRCGRLWIVDPIDGTRAYLAGRDDWGISIALVEHGEPVIAAFYAPVRNAFYFAVKGGGAWCNDRPIHVSLTPNLEAATMMGDPVAFKTRKTWPYPWPDGMKTTAANSMALRLCMVADGSADCCVTLRPKNDWDVAAAELILKEAGGKISTGHNSPLIFNTEKPFFDHIVASNGLLMDDTMARVRPALDSWDPKSRKP